MKDFLFTIFLHEKHGIKFSQVILSSVLIVAFVIYISSFSYLKSFYNTFVSLIIIWLFVFSIINLTFYIIMGFKKRIRSLLQIKFLVNLFYFFFTISIIVYYISPDNFEFLVSIYILNWTLFFMYFNLFKFMIININIPIFGITVYERLINSKCKLKTVLSYKTKFFIFSCFNFFIIILASSIINFPNGKILDQDLPFLILFPLIPSALNLVIYPLSPRDSTHLFYNIPTEYINLSYENIIKSKLYFENSVLNKRFRVHRVDLSEILKDMNGESYKITITNLNFVKSKHYDEHTSSIPIFYIAKNYVMHNDYMIVKLSIREGKKSKVNKIVLKIFFSNTKKEVSHVKTEIIENYKTYSPITLSEFLLKNKNTSESEIYHSLFFYNYQNDEDFINKNIEESTNEFIMYDERKWILHDADFGKGKSVADVLYASKLNLSPIVVSAFEEQSRGDFLYSIYITIYKTVYSPSIYYDSSTRIFFFLILFSVYTVLISNYETLYSVFHISKILTTIRNHIENSSFIYINFTAISNTIGLLFLVVFLPIFIYRCVKKLLPFIIIFKKNSSYYYQSFFIQEISRMLKENKSILIIEDIDRLSCAEDIKNIFSILSSINSFNSSMEDAIGIIALDSKRIEKLTDSKFVRNISNKLIVTTFKSNYKDKSLYNYTNEVIKALDFLYGEKPHHISKKDFRSAHSDIAKEIKRLELLKKEKEKNINGIKVM